MIRRLDRKHLVSMALALIAVVALGTALVISVGIWSKADSPVRPVLEQLLGGLIAEQADDDSGHPAIVVALACAVMLLIAYLLTGSQLRLARRHLARDLPYPTLFAASLAMVATIVAGLGLAFDAGLVADGEDLDTGPHSEFPLAAWHFAALVAGLLAFTYLGLRWELGRERVRPLPIGDIHAGGAPPPPSDELDGKPEEIPDAKHLRSRMFADRAFRPVAIGSALGAFAFVSVASDLPGGLAWGGLIYAGVVIQAARKAPKRARDAFFAYYAESRGLEQLEDTTLPPVTRLLRRGNERYVERAFKGELPGGIDGTLALYTFLGRSTASGELERFPYTVVLHELARLSHRLTELYCIPRVDYRFADPIRDRLTELRRLELESEALDKRYEIFFSPDDDEVWLKRVFVPSFIVWVEREPPLGYHFEVEGRNLVAYVRGHYQSATQLDKLCEAAAAVAERLVSEASE